MKPPLSERLRPKSLEEIVGQGHLLDEGGLINLSVKAQTPFSIILWGPPGTGKTTIAMLYAAAFQAHFVHFSAVLSGVPELRKLVRDAQELSLLHRQTVLFVDEIHRFNKAQQDVFLPYLEQGLFILVGATTENPSFSLTNPLLSRVRVLTLNLLNEDALDLILKRYEKLNRALPLTKDARSFLIELAQGDGRYLLNIVESLESIEIDIKCPLDVASLEYLLQKRLPHFYRSGEEHFNLISALHKSIRSSDADAALYWLARMLEAGEDPRYISRRLIRVASEDIALADPQALVLAIAARDAYEVLGSPEGELAIAQVVVYLSLAPKSNAVYKAFQNAVLSAKATSQFSPPLSALNPSTKMMKELGYGKGYIYDHDRFNGFAGQNHFPKEMEFQSFYKPVKRGFEREMLKRQTYFSRLRKSLEKDHS